MRKVLTVLLSCLFLITAVYGDIVGTDSFDYANGPLDGKTGGTGWDWKGVGNPQGIAPTSWLNMAGITDVANGVLVLEDTGRRVDCRTA